MKYLTQDSPTLRVLVGVGLVTVIALGVWTLLGSESQQGRVAGADGSAQMHALDRPTPKSSRAGDKVANDPVEPPSPVELATVTGPISRRSAATVTQSGGSTCRPRGSISEGQILRREDMDCEPYADPVDSENPVRPVIDFEKAERGRAEFFAKHSRDEIAVMFREAEEAYIQATDTNREEAQKKYFRMLHYVSSRGVDDTRENGGE